MYIHIGSIFGGLRMMEDDIKERVGNIIDLLQSDDSSNQAAALKSLIVILKDRNLSKEEYRQILPEIIRLLENQASMVQEEAIEAGCHITKNAINMGKQLFPLFKKTLEQDNRFLATPILDLMKEVGYVPDEDVKNLVEHVIREAPIIFKKEHMRPLFTGFIDAIIGNDFRFIRRYKDALEEIIDSYPESFQPEREKISTTITKYNLFLEEEERKRKEREEKAKQAELERKQKMEKQIKEAKDARSAELEKQAEKYKINPSDNRPETSDTLDTGIAPNSTQPGETPKSPATSSPPSSSGNIDSIRDNNEGVEGESGHFTTFSSLGLRRKDPDSDDED